MPAIRRRPVLIGLLYLVAWTALDLAAQKFAPIPEISVWQPAFGLDVALLLVCGLGFWPLLVLSRLLHELLVMPQPLPPLALLTVAAGTALGQVGAVWLLRRLGVDPRLPRLRDVILFVWVAVLGAPLALAALQMLLLFSAGRLPWALATASTLQLWAGTATGAGLLAPPLLLWLRRWPGLWTALPPGGPPPEPPAARIDRRPSARLGALTDVVLIGLALWIGSREPHGNTIDSSYALFVPVLWVATRHGFERAALTVLVLNVGAALLIGGDEVRRGGGHALQFGLLTVTVSGLLLGAVMRERRRLTAQLLDQTLRDPLTGLGNRRLFGERVAQALSVPPAPGHAAAVLLMDFDDFKAINDSLGHAAGDEVLSVVGRRLQGSLRPADTVARLGGDEFAVLLERVRGPQEAEEVAERLLRALQPPIPVRGFSLNVSASVGIALHDSGEPNDTLLRNADVALYRAKAQRRGRAQLFDAPMHAEVLRRLELEAELRAALERGAFEVRYQPLVEVDTGLLRGFEALVRWPHPARGLLTPPAFIPLAEETGLIVALDRWVLREACREVAGWPAAPGRAPVSVSVNLSAAHVQVPDLAAAVRGALDESGLSPSRLMLELTENVLMSDTAGAVNTLRALRHLGVRLALDDFGTGYSSLSYLRQFPISDLKVDRSFIRDLGEGGVSTELARLVAALGETLGLSTTAEGIETPQQYAQVRTLGYRLAQGYFIARPLPAAAARALATQPGPLLSLPGVSTPGGRSG